MLVFTYALGETLFYSFINHLREMQQKTKQHTVMYRLLEGLTFQGLLSGSSTMLTVKLTTYVSSSVKTKL